MRVNGYNLPWFDTTRLDDPAAKEVNYRDNPFEQRAREHVLQGIKDLGIGNRVG